VSASFHIDQDGDLVIRMNNEEITISHLVALELIEHLRYKLYEIEEKDSFIKKIFR
jgi:hypothetical protein